MSRPDPYDSPILSTRASLQLFIIWASWRAMALYLAVCLITIIYNQVEWVRLSPLDRLNLCLSILAPALEIVMLMAQKALAEHDRAMIAHAEKLAERDDVLVQRIAENLETLLERRR